MLRFLTNFFLGCLNATFKKVSKFSSSSLRFLRIKRIEEVTFGGGTKFSAPTSKSSSPNPTVWVSTESPENSFSPACAENFFATSF